MTLDGWPLSAVEVGYLATQLGGQLYVSEFDGVAVAGRPGIAPRPFQRL
jgi:hypothetical protein